MMRSPQEIMPTLSCCVTAQGPFGSKLKCSDKRPSDQCWPMKHIRICPPTCTSWKLNVRVVARIVEATKHVLTDSENLTFSVSPCTPHATSGTGSFIQSATGLFRTQKIRICF